MSVSQTLERRGTERAGVEPRTEPPRPIPSSGPADGGEQRVLGDRRERRGTERIGDLDRAAVEQRQPPVLIWLGEEGGAVKRRPKPHRAPPPAGAARELDPRVETAPSSKGPVPDSSVVRSREFAPPCGSSPAGETIPSRGEASRLREIRVRPI